MSEAILQIYHRLPGPVRSVAASVRGMSLRWWRYGPDTDRLVAEATEREYWDAAMWQRWRKARLAVLLEKAVTDVPYYREQWNERHRRGDKSSWRELENWPILEKETIRQHSRNFVADTAKIKNLKHVHTSGTTGKSLDLWRSKKTDRAWYALFEARCRNWHKVSRHDRWAILGGRLVTPVSMRQPPFWVWNAALNQLYMSSYHLAPDLIPYYLDALSDYGIHYLYGYSSSLYELAQAAIRLGIDKLKMEVALTNAEPIFDYQREAIEKAFGCPVRETYGMAEIAAAASECEHGRLHLWPDVGHTEVDDETGDFLCTGLLNDNMPLIRYRVGDRVRLSDADVSCRCGRTLPQIAAIEGRVDDVLVTRDGRRIGRLDPVFKTDLPIREAQIIQEAIDRIRIRYVPDHSFTNQTGELLTKRLQSHLGNVDIVLEALDQIPRTANGKFRAVVSHLL